MCINISFVTKERWRVFHFIVLVFCLNIGQAIADSRYIDSGNGTVTDKTTGLTWMRCLVGQFWYNGACNGNYEAYYQESEVTGMTSTFAGYSDWRVPKIRELLSIIDKNTLTGFDPILFPNVMEFMWSATRGIFSSGSGAYDQLWSVINGSEGPTAGGGHIQLVRGQSSTILSDSRPDADYANLGDGTVIHTPTKLMWKRCAQGQTWTGTTCEGYASAFVWDEALRNADSENFAGYSDWRLPSIDELESLLDYTSANYQVNVSDNERVRINQTSFPNTPTYHWHYSTVEPYYFWSGTPYPLEPYQDWVATFGIVGAATWHTELGKLNFVRLVRTVRSYAMTITKTGTGSGMVTSSPAGINCGTSCVYSYSDGTKVTLTAVADAGSAFVGWSGGGCAGTGTCVVTVNAAKSVTATFNRTYSLIVFRSGTGAGTVTSQSTDINCGAYCNKTYASATQIILTATPESGSSFVSWSGGGCSGAGKCLVTMDANKTINATFNRLPLPDFVITGITLTPTSPVANTNFTANVTVKNQGAGLGYGRLLTVWLDRSVVQACHASGGISTAVGALVNGESKTIAINGLTAAKGSKTLRAFVDSACTSTESNEGNNQFTKPYIVR